MLLSQSNAVQGSPITASGRNRYRPCFWGRSPDRSEGADLAHSGCLSLRGRARTRVCDHASGTINVAGLIGPGGGPQAWNFTDGPVDDTHRYRNLAPADSPSPGSFPSAMIAEKLTIASTGKSGHTYFAKNTNGRELLGFNDGIANPDFPLVIFRSPLVEFPRIIEFGTQWSDTTTFPTHNSCSACPTISMSPSTSIPRSMPLAPSPPSRDWGD